MTLEMWRKISYPKGGTQALLSFCASPLRILAAVPIFPGKGIGSFLSGDLTSSGETYRY